MQRIVKNRHGCRINGKAIADVGYMFGQGQARVVCSQPQCRQEQGRGLRIVKLFQRGDTDGIAFCCQCGFHFYGTRPEQEIVQSVERSFPSIDG
ncbi:hypothetical protein D9M71_623010 [compost metagenome]